MRLASHIAEVLHEADGQEVRQDRRRVAMGCLIGAAGAALLFHIVRLAFDSPGESHIPASLFLAVVAGAALYAGWRPALFAMLVSFGTLLALMLERDGALAPTLLERLELAGFAILSLCIGILAQQLRGERARIESKERQLLNEAERARQIMRTLRDNEERLRLATEGSGMGTWDADLRDGKTLWSDRQFELFGYQRTAGGEVLPEMWSNCLHPDDADRVREAASQARRNHDLFQVEYRIVRADNGRVRWLAAIGRYHYDEHGQPVRLVGITFDVTDRKLAEEQLQRIGWMLESRPEPQQRIQPYGDVAQLNTRRVLVDAIGADMLQNVVRDYLDMLQTSAAVYERNGDYALRAFSSGWCRFMDQASRSLCGTADNREAMRSGKWHCHESCWEASRMAMETGQPVDMVCRGGIRLYAVPIRAGNVPVGSMNFGYGDPPTDPEQQRELAERYGVSVEEIAARARDYASRPPFIVEQAKERLRGSARLLGEIVQRRRLEHELQRRLQDLAEADRRKDEFLATLAHELRNPLAPIRNALYILKVSHDDPEKIATTRELMERQITQMVRLIDDLLDVSRITRNKLELRRERVDLVTIIQQAIESSRPQIDAAGHELAVEVPTEPIILDADSVRLAQVLLNLLNNAAKYMDPGGRITLTARREGDQAIVAVKDAGVGIAPEALPRVFEAFYQGKQVLPVHAQGGLGIGLMLAQRLVTLHGGTITAHSEGIGKGTEFIVSLPLAPPEESSTDHPESGEEEGSESLPHLRSVKHRVLVVDDNRDSAESLATLLQLEGNETEMAHDGFAALEAAARMQPDVIVCDIGLPGMSGYDVARAVRKEPWGHDLVLIALTGWGQEQDRRRSSEAGFDYHLVKPVDPGALERLLRLVPVGVRERPPVLAAG